MKADLSHIDTFSEAGKPASFRNWPNHIHYRR
jgi:hypothetical protein